ncbi:hypothetical protein J7382_07400 [Shimia sp. R11_0]|uniref:hypothetical protein n=1 Tax=Shimia sp. R11_0 TaxID=2821096 RepID=UPI001ADC9696|nr:hypothetical protein [Shimia sp. R11_0]MBO9477354.1 hypothetical protein [Shimia sp. R11_0]
MSLSEDSTISSKAMIAIVCWPVFVWLIGGIIAFLASLGGCQISSQGPQPCEILGLDLGAVLYPLWGLGFYLLYVFLWIPIGLVIVGLIRAFRNV